MKNPFRGKALVATPDGLDALSALRGIGSIFPMRSVLANQAYTTGLSSSYAFLYARQPSVRTVVDYEASSAAQLGLKLYSKGALGRGEVDHPVMDVVNRPVPWGLTKELMLLTFFTDFLVHENAFFWKRRADSVDRVFLVRVPPWAIRIKLGDPLTGPMEYEVQLANGEKIPLARSDVIHWSGYTAGTGLAVSRLETLRAELVEEATRQGFLVDLYRNGGAQGGFIRRPLDAPAWSEQARERFESDWAKRSSGGNPTPVLEEGMEFIPASVSPREGQVLQMRAFTLAQVSRVYGMPLGLFLEGADVEAAKRSLYSEVLPPLTKQAAAVLKRQLLEEEYGETDDLFFEFNLDEKLRGDLEKKLSTMVSVAGGPFMTRDEVRALNNLEALPDGQGEEIITPLNVLVGGKPSPQVMPPQDPNGPAQDGSFRRSSIEAEVKSLARHQARAKRRKEYQAELEATVAAFFARQERAVKSRAGAGGGKAFDSGRWNRELAQDLYGASRRIVAAEGAIQAARLQYHEFDVERADEYLARGAQAAAESINFTTEQAGDVADDRAPRIAATLATRLVNFSALEAANQSDPTRSMRLKKWVWSGKANSRHAHMAGETVPLFHQFSNGMAYPGDPKAGSDQVAGCECHLDVL